MKLKSIKENIKEFFLQNPTEKLRVRQIERQLKLPLPSVIRYTKELEKEKLLRHERIANITLYSADRSSKEYLLEKRFFNIKQLYNSGLVQFLIDQYSNPAIITFGSFAKGEDIEKSDIDIYIETPSKKTINLEKFENLLKRKIQLFVYPKIKKVPNPMLANNILNGINVNGFVEVFK
jgi:predicted nucleotidyltransferase